MVTNAGMPPEGIITANFDLREEAPEDNIDEFNPYYYFRDQKRMK